MRGPLCAFGGVHVRAPALRDLERAIDKVCVQHGFPEGEPFKWSPRSGSYQHKHVVGEDRAKLFEAVCLLAREHDVSATVVVVDKSSASANRNAPSAEADAAWLLLERAENAFATTNADGVVVVDTPSGDRASEGKFVQDWAEILRGGTAYVRPQRIALNVLTARSQYIRLLQLADLVTSCTLARVSGEYTYSRRIFAAITPLFRADMGRIGGVGLKIHPDFRYGNLYHWLVGDTHFWRGQLGHPMPIAMGQYFADAGEVDA